MPTSPPLTNPAEAAKLPSGSGGGARGTQSGNAAGADAVSDRQRVQSASLAALAGLLEMPEALIGRLQACQRTAAPLQNVLLRRLGAAPAPSTRAQQVLLAMDSTALLQFARRAGAVRHAHAVLGLLDGDRLRQFALIAGPRAREAAYRWHGLVAATPAPAEAEPVETLVERDGLRCLRAWCHHQPGEIGLRVWLLLPPGAGAEGNEDTLGTRIIETLAGAE